MRIIVHFVIIISLNNDENRCMHPYSRAPLYLCKHNFPFANRKLENLSFRTCTMYIQCVTRENLLQKFFKLTLAQWTSKQYYFCIHLWRRLMHKVTTVWKVSTIFNCNFVVANFPIYSYFDSLYSMLLLFFELCDTCEFPSAHSWKNFNIALWKYVHQFGHALFYSSN